MDRRQHETLARDDASRATMVTTARSLIYDQDRAVGSVAVEHILKEQSWVPTLVGLQFLLLIKTSLAFPQSSFSDRLGPLGFNIFRTLVVDLLHKFEIGVWKLLFIHLLRIISAHDRSLVHVLDQWYVESSPNVILNLTS